MPENVCLKNWFTFFRDREINKATYPALHYPECYLLHDGYKAFYEAYPNLCTGSYLPMKHPQFASEERKFHKKSKSWAAGGGGTVSRTGASSRLLKLWPNKLHECYQQTLVKLA